MRAVIMARNGKAAEVDATQQMARIPECHIASARMTVSMFDEWALDLLLDIQLEPLSRIVVCVFYADYSYAYTAYEFAVLGEEREWDGGNVYFRYRCPWSVYADLQGALSMSKVYRAAQASNVVSLNTIASDLLAYTPWTSKAEDNSGVYITGDYTTDNATVFDNLKKAMSNVDLSKSVQVASGEVLGLSITPYITIDEGTGGVTGRSVGIKRHVTRENSRPNLFVNPMANAGVLETHVENEIHPSAAAPTFGGGNPVAAQGGQGFAYVASSEQSALEWGFYRASKGGTQSDYRVFAFFEADNAETAAEAQSFAIDNVAELTKVSTGYRCQFTIPDAIGVQIGIGTPCTVQTMEKRRIGSANGSTYEKTLGAARGYITAMEHDIVSGITTVSLDFYEHKIPYIQTRKG